MYQRYADAQSWKVAHLSESPGETGGLKEVIVQASSWVIEEAKIAPLRPFILTRTVFENPDFAPPGSDAPAPLSWFMDLCAPLIHPFSQ